MPAGAIRDRQSLPATRSHLRTVKHFIKTSSGRRRTAPPKGSQLPHPIPTAAILDQIDRGRQSVGLISSSSIANEAYTEVEGAPVDWFKIAEEETRASYAHSAQWRRDNIHCGDMDRVKSVQDACNSENAEGNKRWASYKTEVDRIETLIDESEERLVERVESRDDATATYERIKAERGACSYILRNMI